MSAVATRLRRAQESRGSPPEACDDDSCRSDTPPNESEEGSEMRDRCLPDNIKSRQSCLKVFIEDRKPAVHSQSARRDVLGQVLHSQQIHAVAGGAENMVYQERVASIEACFDRAARRCPPLGDP